MQASLGDLNLRFETDPVSAIEFCESVLCGEQFRTISDFISYHKSICPPNCCQRAWNDYTVVVECKECMKNRNSCICLNCYLNGNHKNHKVSFYTSEIGTCDCGDASAWKPEGFCTKHFAPKDENLPPELSTFLTNCFIASLRNMEFLAAYKSDSFVLICHWLKQFSEINFTFKKLVANVILQKVDLPSFLVNFHIYSVPSIKAFLEMITSLVTIPGLNSLLAHSIFPIFPKFIYMISTTALEPGPKLRPYQPLLQLFQICPYAFVHANLVALLQEGYDWVPHISESIGIIFHFVCQNFDMRIYERIKVEILFIWVVNLIMTVEKHLDIQADKIFQFSENLFNSFLPIEGKCPFERAFGEAQDDELKKESTSLHLVFCLGNLIRRLFFCKPVNEDALIGNYFQFIESALWSDEFDSNHDKPIFFRSTISPGVHGTEMLPLHISFMYLLRTKPNKKEFLIDLHQKLNSSMLFDHFLFFLMILPLRLFCVHYQNSIKLFARNSDSFKTALNSLLFKGNVYLRIFPLFGLIQTVLGVIEDKQFATFSIANTLGLLDYDSVDNDEFGQLLLIFVLFLSNIITDITSMHMDLRLYEKLSLSIALKRKSALSISEITNLYWTELNEMDYFYDVIDEVSDRFIQDAETKYKLKDESTWQPIVPFQSLPSFLNNISSFLEKNDGQLLPFPSTFADEDFDELDITSLLFTPSVYAAIYCILSNQVSKKRIDMPSVHISLRLLLLMHKLSQKEFTEETETVTCLNFNELIEKIPREYEIMIKTKIEFGSRRAMSILDMLVELGKIGISVLCQIAPNDPIIETLQSKSETENAEKAIKKAAALAAKQKALEQIQRQTKASSSFEEEIKELNDNENKFEYCSICRETTEDTLWLPMTIFKTSLPNIIMNSPVTNYSAIICTHSIHLNCLGEHSHYFLCSSCRCMKNCLLPIIPNIEEYDKTIIEKFIENFNKAIKAQASTIVQTLHRLISILVGLIVSLEFRNSTNDQFASKIPNKLLISYLYNIILIIQKEFNIRLNPSGKFIPFHSFIIQIVNQNDPDAVLKRFRSELVTENLQIFENHLSLFNHFVLDTELISNSTNLRKNLIDLKFPNMFFEFILPQYGSIPVDKYTLNIGICLFTGKLICIEKDPQTPESAVLLEEHMNTNCKGFCPVLLLTNTNSSLVFIYTDKFNNGIKMRPFYLTTNGDENIGLKEGKDPIFFREQEYQKLLDQLFSGEWIWNLTASDQFDIFMDELEDLDDTENDDDE